MPPERGRLDVNGKLIHVFNLLRQYLEHDLDQLLKEPEGGNYAATLLIVIGCEALSRLRGKPTDSIFIERLMKPYGLSDGMGRDVANALRHGLAHTYDSKYIQAGNLKIELVVSWGQKQHLGIDEAKPGLFLNVRTMRDDLFKVFADVANDLETDSTNVADVPDEWKKKRIEQADPASRAEWKQRFEG